MKKKVLMLSALCLIASLLSANGSKETSASGDITLTPVGTYPIVEEKTEFSVFTPSDASVIDFKTNEFTKWLEEKTNIHVNFEVSPEDAVKEKITLLLASGDYPDIFMRTYIDMTPDIEARYGINEGVFLPLNDLIDDNMVNFKKIMNENPDIRGNITHIDGNIYSLPRVNDCFHCSMPIKMWINKAWLDKAGLGIPETTEEFYNALTYFKEHDMNGNGDASDEIPFAGAREREGWYETVDSFVMNSFIQDNGDNLRLLVEDGEVSSIVNQDKYKEGLKYLAKLYREELIYGPSFTQKHEQLRQLANLPDILIGAFQAGHNQMLFSATADPERYRQYVPIAPLAGPDGTRQGAYFPDSPYHSGQFVITDKCASPEAAIRWIDTFYTIDTAIRECERGGIEGKQFRWAEPGEVGMNGKPAIYKTLVPLSIEPQNDNWHNGSYYPRDFRLGMVTDPSIDPFSPEGLEKLLFETTKDLYEPYINPDVRIAPTLKLTAEEAEETSTIKVELQNYIESSKTKFIMNQSDIDKEWDSYLADLEKIGLSEYLGIMQKAYDRQFSK